MSLVMEVVIIGASPKDVTLLNAWMAENDTQRQQQFMRLDTERAGGTKLFCDGIWAASLNYPPDGMLEKLRDPITWGTNCLGVKIAVKGEQHTEVMMFIQDDVNDFTESADRFACVRCLTQVDSW